jgi:hypothetical protein
MSKSRSSDPTVLELDSDAASAVPLKCRYKSFASLINCRVLGKMTANTMLFFWSAVAASESGACADTLQDR